MDEDEVYAQLSGMRHLSISSGEPQDQSKGQRASYRVRYGSRGDRAAGHGGEASSSKLPQPRTQNVEAARQRPGSPSRQTSSRRDEARDRASLETKPSSERLAIQELEVSASSSSSSSSSFSSPDNSTSNKGKDIVIDESSCCPSLLREVGTNVCGEYPRKRYKVLFRPKPPDRAGHLPRVEQPQPQPSPQGLDDEPYYISEDYVSCLPDELPKANSSCDVNDELSSGYVEIDVPGRCPYHAICDCACDERLFPGSEGPDLDTYVRLDIADAIDRSADCGLDLEDLEAEDDEDDEEAEVDAWVNQPLR